MEESTLAALGVPVNFSDMGPSVREAFEQTYDIMGGQYLDALAELLDHGVKVHLIHGDLDWVGNWVGGEAASLAIPHKRAAEFAAAGYAPLMTPSKADALVSEHTGMTRQVGNLSFTRVFQAGHFIPLYKPAAGYALFTRATFDRDIATGLVRVTDGLTTVGPASTWHIRNQPGNKPEHRCHILNPLTCTADIWETVVNGTAMVRDWFVIDPTAIEKEIEWRHGDEL